MTVVAEHFKQQARGDVAGGQVATCANFSGESGNRVLALGSVEQPQSQRHRQAALTAAAHDSMVVDESALKGATNALIFVAPALGFSGLAGQFAGPGQQPTMLGEKSRRNKGTRTGGIQRRDDIRGISRRWRPITPGAERQDPVAVSLCEQAPNPATHGGQMAEHFRGASKMAVLKQRQQQRRKAHRIGGSVADPKWDRVGNGTLVILGIGEIIADLRRKTADIPADESLRSAGCQIVEPPHAFGALRTVGQHSVLVSGFSAQHGGVHTLQQRMIAGELRAARDGVAHLAADEGQTLKRARGLHVAEAVVREGGFPIDSAAVTDHAVFGAGMVQRCLVDAAVSRKDLGETQRQGLAFGNDAARADPTGKIAAKVIDALTIRQTRQLSQRQFSTCGLGLMRLGRHHARGAVEDVGPKPAASALNLGRRGIETR